MRTRGARLALPFLLVVGMIGGLLAMPLTAGAVPPTVSGVRTDGQTVVWQYNYYSSTLFMRPVNGGASQQVATNADNPDVSGDLLVWEETGSGGEQLAGRHVASGTPLTMPSGPGQQMEPSLSGTRLVWVRHDPANATAPWQIMTVDLAGSAPPAVVASLPATLTDVLRPEISGDRVIWGQRFPSGSTGQPWELWTVQLGGTPVKLVSGTYASSFLSGYDIGGTLAVYAVGPATNPRVHLVNVRDLSTDHVIGTGVDPTTDGRYVFWDTGGAASPMPRGDLLGYDVATDSLFVVAVNTGGLHSTPRTRGGAVAWIIQPPMTLSFIIQASPISAVLPSAPRPDPGTTNPNWTYFGVTGHYLANGFRAFWQQSGGLPVFGYPLTEEFTQHGLTTQYTERQRFEYHPELAGTPYETELGRLGAEEAQAQGLLTTAPFQRLPVGSSPTPGCLLFTETDHQVCGAFLAYWQTHGLNLGDPSLSFRESVALFGYPLSESYVDPATGLQTQYFERAVMEWHPGSSAPYHVELRLLGTEQLRAVGWR